MVGRRRILCKVTQTWSDQLFFGASNLGWSCPISTKTGSKPSASRKRCEDSNIEQCIPVLGKQQPAGLLLADQQRERPDDREIGWRDVRRPDRHKSAFRQMSVAQALEHRPRVGQCAQRVQERDHRKATRGQGVPVQVDQSRSVLQIVPRALQRISTDIGARDLHKPGFMRRHQEHAGAATVVEDGRSRRMPSVIRR